MLGKYSVTVHLTVRTTSCWDLSVSVSIRVIWFYDLHECPVSWWPAPAIWLCSVLYYSNIEYYWHWPFQRMTWHKSQVVCDEWHSFGPLDSKGIRHGQSPLTSASCWRWQTRLRFLCMPGILFTLSFLEFWKACEPPTQNGRAERHTKLWGYSVLSSLPHRLFA